ncbi:hypothetical protein E2562_019348 [Oryza meyeriana var. granulata]|uniref:Uncharacterized protein n=1 Tax=Oryza meyeriana var. granulata TaxID=110450 RepID=A0A6G1BM78_9ORYZ|nr:hypothetical protein E2562_019348 [Oryza meyeriana var. granulata]
MACLTISAAPSLVVLHRPKVSGIEPSGSKTKMITYCNANGQVSRSEANDFQCNHGEVTSCSSRGVPECRVSKSLIFVSNGKASIMSFRLKAGIGDKATGPTGYL